MSALGITATKDHLYLALTSSLQDHFSVIRHDRIAIDADSWPTVLANLRTHFESYSAEEAINRIGLVFCATGRFGASPEAFKAEGLAEMECQQRGLPITRVSKQSLKNRLDCDDGQKWQEAAKVMFNADQSIRHFSQGFDAAISGAYACLA